MCLLHLCGIGGSVDHICTTWLWKKSVLDNDDDLASCVQNFDSDVVGKMKHQIGK